MGTNLPAHGDELIDLADFGAVYFGGGWLIPEPLQKRILQFRHLPGPHLILTPEEIVSKALNCAALKMLAG